MNRFLQVIALTLVLLVAVLLINTVRFSSKQLTALSPAPALTIGDSATTRLAEAIRYRTVSYSDYSLIDTTQFDGFIHFLERSFPHLHQQLRQERVNQYALLYTWPGRNPNQPPVLLMGHYDVVPVIQGTQRMWKRPPFAGQIAGGYVYGRGTLDDKTTVMGLLEAVEYLLKQNFRPERTIMLAFGPDEEVTGQRGARAIADLLRRRGIRPEYVMDEGGIIKTDGIPGLDKPIALVGIGEKGYLSLELTATADGGHSSMPPRQTSIGIIAAAINKLEKNPFPSRLDGGLQSLFDYAGPEMTFGQRLVFANQWLFAPVVRQILAQTPSGDATQRTTTAPTLLRAGVKDNVLPIDAMATVNFRILPGESIQSVMDHVRTVIDDKRVSIRPTTMASSAEPSLLSDPSAAPFMHLHRTIKRVFPDVVVAPYLVLGGTDSRFFRSICPNVYRFMPARMNDDALKLPHGTNERIAISDYQQMIRFYATLIRDGR